MRYPLPASQLNRTAVPSGESQIDIIMLEELSDLTSFFGNQEYKVYQMYIELIGSTSAGKTTLARKMAKAGKTSGVNVSLSDDFMLEQMRLNWIKNEFARRRLVELIAFLVLLTCLSRHKEFVSFVIREGRNSPGSGFYKINRIRNVIRKIGILEFVAQKSGSRQLVLADNEGILQGVHNLFVHENSQVDLTKIARYVEMAPLPDVVLYLQQEEDVLISRTLARGHGRVKSAQDNVRHFIRQAVIVFNEMVKLPALQGKLLIVNGQLNIQYNEEDPRNIAFRQIQKLVQAGRAIS